MPFDSLTTTAASQETANLLLGAKVIKIHQPDRFSILLRLHHPGGNAKLLISAHPVFGRFHLTETQPENPATPPMFCMVLRKHLENSKLVDIQQLGDDRIVFFDFDATDEIGTPVKRRLILEIMGKHSNLILIDPAENIILDGIRRYSHQISRHREVLPGKPYLLPPSNEKITLDHLTLETLQQLCLKESETQGDLVSLLYQNIAGLSPFLAKEILYRAQIAEESVDFLGDYEYQKLWQSLQEIQTIKTSSAFQPVLLKNETGFYDYYPIPLTMLEPAEQVSFATLSEALDRYFQIAKEQNLFRNQHRELEKIIQKEAQRLRKKIALQQTDYDQTVHAERFKDAGDLLTAYLYQLAKGMQEITLESFYEPGKQITISLLPELAPMENIKRYYKKYNKAKSSQRFIEEQLNANCAELDYIETLEHTLAEAENNADLQEIKKELTESGYLKPKTYKKGQQPKAKIKERTEPPRQYQSSDGYTILVGRNNKQNDKLTLKMADKQDIWLHTQKIPGSHTIIKRKGNEPISDVALLEAAALAAWHSKARHSSQVPVDYTLVSQVKKPNGAKPGMVIYFQQKTLYVTPQDLPQKVE